MKKTMIALAALAVIGMGTAMAASRAYLDGYNSAVEGSGNTCDSYKNPQSEYNCNRGYVQGTSDMNNASGN